MKNRILKIVLIMLFVLCMYQITSNAGISASSRTVNSGETVSISITSDTPVYSYRVKVTNNAGLTFVSSSGGTGAGTETITDAKESTMTSFATFTYRVPTVSTDTTYTLTFYADAMDGQSGEIAPSSATAKITVKVPTAPAPSSKSSNANLTGIEVSSGELVPAFDKNTKEYTLHVTKDITEIDISGIRENSKSTYTVSGNKELEVGENIVTITVTAEDGTKNIYTITVIRADKLIMPLASLSIEGFELIPEFDPEVFEYTLELSEYMKELKIIAIAQDENTSIEIIGAKDLKEGENVILIKIKSEDGLEETIYQITVIVPAEIVEENEEEENKGIFGGIFNISRDKWIAIGVGVMTVATIIMLIVEKYKEVHPKEAKSRIEEEMESDDGESKDVYDTMMKKLDILAEDKNKEEERRSGKHF